MASSFTPKQRVKRACAKNVEASDVIDTDYLDSWFAGNRESIQEFYREYSRKVIIVPKFIKMLWFKEQNLDEGKEVLKF